MLQCAFLYRSADGAIYCRDVLCCVLQQPYAEHHTAVYVCFGATPRRQAFGRAGSATRQMTRTHLGCCADATHI